MTPGITLMMTVNHRAPEVLRSVLTAIKVFQGNQCYERFVIVNDRGDRGAIERSLDEVGIEADIIDIEGPAGYRGQAKAWNAGYAKVTTSHVMCISSDCILLPWSVRNARWFMDNFPEMVVYGRGEHCGRNYTTRFITGNGAMAVIGKTICSSTLNIPDPYAWLLPMKVVRELRGWDEEMSDGICFDSADMYYRIAKSGFEVALCDDICAVHIEHDKAHVSEDEKIEHNRKLFEAKHGEFSHASWKKVSLDNFKIIAFEHPTISFCLNKFNPSHTDEEILELATKSYLAENPLKPLGVYA